MKYKQLRGKLSQESAATRVGFSVSSAYRIERRSELPSQRDPRPWRTRIDPLAQVWDEEVVSLLESAPTLMAVTVLEELQRSHPGRFGQSILRTLQRRIRAWRAQHGAERELYFAQEHPPRAAGVVGLHRCR